MMRRNTLYTAICIVITIFLFTVDGAYVHAKNSVVPEKSYVIAEQSKRAIAIVDANTGDMVWSWDPYMAGIPLEHLDFFINPSEVKPVYNKKYILMTASGGGVALVRINDCKLMFYGYAGINPHSVEVLPDGNIVTASSTGNQLSVFVVDTMKVFCSANQTLELKDAHNVVWDKKRKQIYTAASMEKSDGQRCVALYSLKYNNNKNMPELTDMKCINVLENDRGPHDLFPVDGEMDKLWLTTLNYIWKYDVEKNEFEKAYDIKDIKSIDNVGDNIIMLKPTEEWWAEGLLDKNGKSLFFMEGKKIYKGRWMKNNLFSYPEIHELK